jgi:hypothetical protein
MITRHKSSKLPPRAMLEVPNVLKGAMVAGLLCLLSPSWHKVANKCDQKHDAAGNKDWGISVAGKEGIPPASKEVMMLAVLTVDKVKLLAAEQRNDES